MTTRSRMVIALALGLLVSGAASDLAAQGDGGRGGQGGGRGAGQGPGQGGGQRGGQGRPAAPPVKPIGKETAATKKAELALLQDKPEEALAAIQADMAANANNALYHAIAGEAAAEMGDVDAANQHFAEAARLAPGSESTIDARRASAWAKLYNQGAAVYAKGDVDATIATWEKANAVAPKSRYEGYMNLAILYTGKKDYDKAIAAYQQALEVADQPATGLSPEYVADRTEAQKSMSQTLGEVLLFTEKYSDAEKLFRSELEKNPSDVALQSKLAAAIAAQPGRAAEASAMYDKLLAAPNLTASDYNDIGIALFTAKNYPRAAEAFAKVSAARPNSREAWYNQANALYAGKLWPALLPVAQKLVAVDPLYEDSWLLLKEAQRNGNQNAEALKTLQAIEAFPVKLEDMTVRSAGTKLTVHATAVGTAAAAGTPVQLRFTFYNAQGGEIGTQTATITAPAKDAETQLEVTQDLGTATSGGFKYEVVR